MSDPPAFDDAQIKYLDENYGGASAQNVHWMIFNGVEQAQWTMAGAIHRRERQEARHRLLRHAGSGRTRIQRGDPPRGPQRPAQDEPGRRRSASPEEEGAAQAPPRRRTSGPPQLRDLPGPDDGDARLRPRDVRGVHGATGRFPGPDPDAVAAPRRHPVPAAVPGVDRAGPRVRN